MGSFFVIYAVMLSGAGSLLAAASSGGVWETVITAVIGIAATALAWVIGMAARGIAKKAGYDLTARQEYAIRAATRTAIMWVAEKSAVAERAGNKMPSTQKLQLAVTRLVEKVPGISRTEAVELVQESLTDVGEGAVIALGKLAEAAVTPDSAS